MFGSHKKNIKRLLVIRFSAMGDVAMTVPVLYTLAVQNPELRITMLTRTRFTPLYEWLPTNVQVKGIDLQKYDGIMGLTRLYKSLQNLHVDAVADLHDVLRSKYLRTCFSLSGTQIAVVQKGRKEKKALIGHGQEHPALQPMIERYADVFRSLGLTINLSQTFSPNLKCEDFSAIWMLTGKKVEGEKWIGVAPFAAHRQKIYPVDKMQQVVNMLAEHGHKIWISKIFNPLVWIGSFFVPAISKMFSDSYYVQEMSTYDFEYQLVSFEESIKGLEIHKTMK